MLPNSCPHTDTINRIEKDMYFGNGKPGITTRMQVGEERMDRFEKAVEGAKKRDWAIIILLLGSLVTAITDMAKQPRYPAPIQHSDLY